METIELRHKGIQGFEITKGYAAYHKYTVYTDSDDNSYVARGGPSPSGIIPRGNCNGS